MDVLSQPIIQAPPFGSFLFDAREFVACNKRGEGDNVSGTWSTGKDTKVLFESM